MTALVIVTIVYVSFWIISTVVLFGMLTDNFEKDLTKKDVVITLIIPFYPILKEAFNNFKKLK